MRSATSIITFVLALALLLPVSAGASWWRGGGEQRDLDLESGYDANTVTTVTGVLTGVSLDNAHPQARLEMATEDGDIVVVLGPRSYWAEHGIALESGDRVTVRGSKAQGQDGVVYIMAQWLREESGGLEVALRNESGQPAWGGKGTGSRFGRNSNHSGPPRMHTPGRAGGRRLGR